MNRSTARWTTAFAATAWLCLPAAGLGQTPPSTPSSKAQQPPAAGAQQQPGAAQEHLRQAQQALSDIPAASLPARAKSRISELKRHLTALEKSAASSGTGASGTTGATRSKTTARAKSNWATEVAAIDKTLTELLGSTPSSRTGAPAGATGTAGSSGANAKASQPVTLDETTKAKLMEVRTHVTAFAAAMSGSTSQPPPSPAPSEPATDPAAAPAAQPPAAAAGQPSSTPAQQPSATPTNPAQANQPGEQPSSAAAQQVDAETAKRHLTAARDSLTQLTQLPAAAQLTGDARTQVSQLITNFNGLIGSTTNWRAEYDKVNANLTMLLGPAAAAGEPQTPPAGTPGAVGTSGTATLDPAVRAKLVEFREHLMQFEKAAGGTSEPTPSAAAAAAPSSSAPTSPSTPPTATPSPAAPPASAEQQPPSTTRPQPGATTPQPSEAMNQSDAIRHIEAIEAILSGRSATPGGATPPSSTPPTTTPPSTTPGAAGTTGTTPGGPVTLDRAQLEQIRMHLAELRKAVEKK